MTEKRGRKSQASDIPPLEWAVGGFGALIVAAVIGFLLYQGVAGEPSPPDIHVEIKEIAPVRDGFRVRFEAYNAGDEAASQITIEGVLTRPGGEPERREVTLAYLPGQSERGGGLFFEADPRRGDLDVRARSYEDP
jgi:uncharacterized protein (TIGR02588 family)